MSEQYLDCKELSCPMPIVRISQTMKKMETGAILVVEATDPAFRPDVEAWVKKLGHELIEFEDGTVKRASIRRAG